MFFSYIRTGLPGFITHTYVEDYNDNTCWNPPSQAVETAKHFLLDCPDELHNAVIG